MPEPPVRLPIGISDVLRGPWETLSASRMGGGLRRLVRVEGSLGVGSSHVEDGLHGRVCTREPVPVSVEDRARDLETVYDLVGATVHSDAGRRQSRVQIRVPLDLAYEVVDLRVHIEEDRGAALCKQPGAAARRGPLREADAWHSRAYAGAATAVHDLRGREV